MTDYVRGYSKYPLTDVCHDENLLYIWGIYNNIIYGKYHVYNNSIQQGVV